MSDSQAKRTLPRMLITLLITLVIGAVWFYVSLPALNLHIPASTALSLFCCWSTSWCL